MRKREYNVKRFGERTSLSGGEPQPQATPQAKPPLSPWICLLLAGCVCLVMISVPWLFSFWRSVPASASATPTPSAASTPASTVSPSPSPIPAPTPTPTPVPTPEPPRVEHEFPYYIKVNQGAQIVTVYTVDEQGEYTIPVKHMICSTSQVVGKTPNGIYPAKDKQRWHLLLSQTEKMFYGQYTTRITGSYVFHSVPYSAPKPDTLYWEKFNDLGQRASGGCVRLQVKDAKWIYDNIPAGTPIELYTGDPDPALWNALKPAALTAADHWDPSDPDPANPSYLQEPDATPEPTPYPYATAKPLNIQYSREEARITPRPSPTPTPTLVPSPTPLISPAPEAD